jgi:hypothetical protein
VLRKAILPIIQTKITNWTLECPEMRVAKTIHQMQIWSLSFLFRSQTSMKYKISRSIHSIRVKEVWLVASNKLITRKSKIIGKKKHGAQAKRKYVMDAAKAWLNKDSATRVVSSRRKTVISWTQTRYTTRTFARRLRSNQFLKSRRSTIEVQVAVRVIPAIR